MIRRNPTIFVLLLFATFILSACGVASAIEQPQAMPEAVEPASDEESVVTDEQPTVTDIFVASATPTEMPAATQAEPTPTEAVAEAVVETAPTPRSDLYATPPGEVNLASGELQLVEFFAHW